jgi:beta-phosphoglucomutase-like phosphatase (HAD superfamily)
VGYPAPAAIVLDFDGVLADSEPIHLAAYQEVLAKIGIGLSAEDYYERYLGFDDAGVFEAVAADRRVPLGADEIGRLIDRKAGMLERMLKGPSVLFPGVAERVREHAAAVPMAIASGARREEIEWVLAAAGLRSSFAVIVAAGDSPRGKPAPDPYERALALLVDARAMNAAAPRSLCVAVEDSRWGISSAKTAGLTCVGVTTSYPAEALAGADAVVDSLTDLTRELLAELLSEVAGR